MLADFWDITELTEREVVYLYFISIALGVLGLLIGSFLNVVIYRIPQGQSIVWPGSHCPACGQGLKAWELIPVLSFLIQKGQCRNCQAPIPWRYPAVELLTGALFFFAGLSSLGTYLPPARLSVNLVFIAVLIALAFIDLDTFRLPDALTLPLLGLGTASAFFISGGPTLGESIFSALGAGGVFLVIALAYPQGMGLGDVKLVAAMGAFLGFPAIFLAIFAGSLAGSLVGIFLLATRQKRFRQQIPFGPYLAFGAIFTLLWGSYIFNWYWSLW